MPALTELEQLAKMVGGGEEREPLDTGDMLSNALRAKLGAPSAAVQEQIRQEIEASGAQIEKAAPIVSQNRRVKLPENVSTEDMLALLYDSYDKAVDAYEIAVQTEENHDMVCGQIHLLINNIIAAIRLLGQKMEPFNPLDHVSGLTAPDITRSAEQVANNTKKYYTKGLVKTDVNYDDNGKTINVIFSGTSKQIAYSAIGTITSDEWSGGEAIDYVYTPQGGKMSVKELSGGRWQDVSSKFDLTWELIETPIEDESEEKSEKNVITVKGEADVLQNNGNIESDRTSVIEGKEHVNEERNDISGNSKE
jgi:hypothetical protein